MDFRISDPEWLSIFPWNRAQLSRPCAKEEGEGKARGGIIKIFHRCSISLRPGGAASKNTESKYFEKIGSSEIRKSGPERNSCWGERIARKRQREGEGGRENSGENGAWRRVSAFIESRKKSLEIGPISATSLCDGSIELKFVEEKAKALRIIRFVPNLPICFPFTASLYLFSPSPLPLSFFILSRIFFFLPFLLPRRARRERERIRNWVGEEANHAEKMKYRGKLRVNADARVGWVRRFGRVPTTCWPMRRIWPNAKFGKSNEGTRFFLSLSLSLVFLWRLTVYRDFSKERGLFSLSTRIYIYLFQLFNKVYKKSCRYW